jgi:tRNA dimethylallyltransferase
MIPEKQNENSGVVSSNDITEKTKSRFVLVLVGPTASGKTNVALHIATQINGEIISADSRQLFRSMDIGTAKPTVAERSLVKHYFIDERNPDEDFNAGEFGKSGREVIDSIFRKGRTPMVVGGSGLYIQSLVDGFFEGPSADASLRDRLYERLEREGAEVLLEELRVLDPVAAAKMLPSNTRRIIRALEVVRLTGLPISVHHKSRLPINFSPVFVGLDWDRAELYDRINIRVDRMIEAGLIREAEMLTQNGYSPDLNALQTVGYAEVFDFLNKETDLSTAIELIKRNTRRYAKRQLTWFRRDARIKWFHVSTENQIPGIADEIVTYFGKESGRADLNRRPLGPEPSALAGLSHAP